MSDMESAYDPETTAVMASALQGALSRLKMLRLVDGDAEAASVTLSRLIMAAVDIGERNEESLILYAIGRFQAHRTGDGRARE
jgi:hypothetical protein